MNVHGFSSWQIFETYGDRQPALRAQRDIGSLKITVITAVFNNRTTISTAIESVIGQSCAEQIEYVVIDGMSSDGTSDIIETYLDRISAYYREPDDGIYDALNKGIARSSGDIIGFVHADDVLADEHVIEMVRDKFVNEHVDAVYGDLVYVDQDMQRVVRYWKSGDYDHGKFRLGWMPPHPTVFVRREVYQRYGSYRTDFGSSADYECMLRLMYKNHIRVGYIGEIITKMRVGGESNESVVNRLKANQRDQESWTVNGLDPPFGLRISKPVSKLMQYFNRPR